MTDKMLVSFCNRNLCILGMTCLTIQNWEGQFVVTPAPKCCNSFEFEYILVKHGKYNLCFTLETIRFIWQSEKLNL